MDRRILQELCRAWRARSEESQRRNPVEFDDSEEGRIREAELSGRLQAETNTLETCADELESVLSIYGPLLRD